MEDKMVRYVVVDDKGFEEYCDTIEKAESIKASLDKEFSEDTHRIIKLVEAE